MNSVEKEAVLHCLRAMIDEELCEECPLYGTTGTDHCEKDCVRLAINELEQEPCEDAISRKEAISIASIATLSVNQVVTALEKLPPVNPQKPCEPVRNPDQLDCVNRQAVLDTEYQTIDINGVEYVMLSEVQMKMRKLSPVSISETLNNWISVSERLPEINQRVLVTSYGRVCYAMMTSEDGNSGYPVFRLQDSLNERVVCETTVHSEFTTSRISAWMPLPEPYKAESEEE